MPPALQLGKRLAACGHRVLFVSDHANESAVRSAGLEFTTWKTAPNRRHGGAADDPLQDWRSRWPPAVVRAICDAVITAPAHRYAQDTLHLIDTFRPDVLVSNELLFGCIAAAESRKIALALLTANVWCFPTRADVPPFGPGFAPATGHFARHRERTARDWIARLYDVGLPALNDARAQLHLPPLRHVLQQLDAARLVLLGTSRAFDYDVVAPPAPFRYAGPLLSVPEWADTGPLHTQGEGPLVLVSFSTAYQNQAGPVARSIAALARLPVRGLVTLGPAIDSADLPRAGNVTVVGSVSHDQVMPACAAVICHGGHGTLLRPLMHGVPVVCVPGGRDQPENAARLAWHGAGLRLGGRASAGAIANATRRVLAERSFRDAAQRIGAAIRAEADGGSRAVRWLEELAVAQTAD